MKFRACFALITVFAAALAAPHAGAQSAAAQTARDAFVLFLQGGEVRERESVPEATPESETSSRLPLTLEDLINPNPRKRENDMPVETNAAEISDLPNTERDSGGADLTEADTINAEEIAAPPETISPDVPASKPDNVQQVASVIPFYTDAKNYLAARGGTDPAPQLRLTYDVAMAQIQSGVATDPKQVELVIGPDYVSVTRENTTRLFDFRGHRLISIFDIDGTTQLNHVSLHNTVYKHIELINQMTAKGSKTSINLAPGKSLDAFWLESSIGWTARDISAELGMDSYSNTVEFRFDGKAVTTLDFSGPEFPSPQHRDSLVTFWHHDLAIHPAALQFILMPAVVPSGMKITTYSPNFPDGLNAIWTLRDSETVTGRFPLPEDAVNVLDAASPNPLAFAIAEGARGRAPVKYKSDQAYREDYRAALRREDFLTAWINAVQLAERQDGCENDPALLCEDIAEIAASAPDESDLRVVTDAYGQTRDNRIKTLLPDVLDLARAETAPPFLLRLAGELRSKVNFVGAPDPDMPEPAEMLEAALIRDPHDPVTYRSLAKVYAAQGRIDESWDIHDALRALPAPPDSLTAPINRVERSLMERAPGYYLPEQLENLTK